MKSRTIVWCCIIGMLTTGCDIASSFFALQSAKKPLTTKASSSVIGYIWYDSDRIVVRLPKDVRSFWNTEADLMKNKLLLGASMSTIIMSVDGPGSRAYDSNGRPTMGTNDPDGLVFDDDTPVKIISMGWIMGGSFAFTARTADISSGSMRVLGSDGFIFPLDSASNSKDIVIVGNSFKIIAK